jgi:uncharacterized protein (DUF924 family)
MTADALEEVLAFWLGPPDGAGSYADRAIWFDSTPAFDDELRQRFLDHHETAAAEDRKSTRLNSSHRVA